MSRVRFGLTALVCALLVAGCGSSNQVGSQALENFTPAPSPRAQPSPTPSASQLAAAHPSPTAQQKAQAPPAVTVTVAINADTTNPQLNPQSISIAVGTIVKWINHDTVPRGVQAAGGAFHSPSIAPGGSWTYTFSVAGTYDYSDSTRPYVTGQVTVH